MGGISVGEDNHPPSSTETMRRAEDTLPSHPNSSLWPTNPVLTYRNPEHPQQPTAAQTGQDSTHSGFASSRTAPLPPPPLPVPGYNGQATSDNVPQSLVVAGGTIPGRPTNFSARTNSRPRSSRVAIVNGKVSPAPRRGSAGKIAETKTKTKTKTEAQISQPPLAPAAPPQARTALWILGDTSKLAESECLCPGALQSNSGR